MSRRKPSLIRWNEEPLRRQLPDQRARRAVQRLGRLVERAVHAPAGVQQFAHLQRQRVLLARREDPVARRAHEELAHLGRPAADRQPVHRRREGDRGMRRVEPDGGGKQDRVVLGKGRPREREIHAGQRHLAPGQPGGDAVRELEQQHVAEAVRQHGRAARLELDANGPIRLLRHGQAEVVQQQVPEACEAPQRGTHRRRVHHRSAQRLERARADRAAPQPHHFVARANGHLLVQPHDLVVRDAPARALRVRHEPGTRQEGGVLRRAAAGADALQPVIDEGARDGREVLTFQRFGGFCKFFVHICKKAPINIRSQWYP